MKWKRLFTIFSLLVLVYSCVPHRKYLQSQSEVENLNAKTAAMQTNIDQLQKDQQLLTAQQIKLTQELENLKRDSIAMQKALDMQIKAYENLTQVQQKTISNNESENSKMLTELNKRSEELKKKELELAAKEELFIASQGKNKNLSLGLVEREAKILELEKALKQKDSAVKALNKNVANALKGYNNMGLTITEKDGKVYVSLEEKLLFKSGSYAIDEKGKAVLLNVAKALNENSDITIMIEGHTDNVPLLGKGVIKDNWDLSVLRATTIVRILVEDGKVNPTKIIPCGRGEFSPIDKANTADARQANRRIEIILTPKLSELLKSLE